MALMTALAQPKVLVPQNAAKPVGPYSPGLAVNGMIFASGQGALDAAGKMPEGIEAQTRQCLENVKAILAAGGATLDHVVTAQLYLLDLANLPVVEKVWAEYFGKNRPPRITLGVAKMPVGTPVEITVYAVEDLKKKRNETNAVFVGYQAYWNAIYAKDARGVTDQFQTLARNAQHTSVQMNLYKTGGPGPGVVVEQLPEGAVYAGFPVTTSARQQEGRAACTIIDRFAYCTATSSEPSLPIEEQVEAVFQALRRALGGSGFGLEYVVATNVYLPDIELFQKMNAAYATNFPTIKPTRTTVQPAAVGRRGPFSVSVVAVK